MQIKRQPACWMLVEHVQSSQKNQVLAREGRIPYHCVEGNSSAQKFEPWEYRQTRGNTYWEEWDLKSSSTVRDQPTWRVFYIRVRSLRLSRSFGHETELHCLSSRLSAQVNPLRSELLGRDACSPQRHQMCQHTGFAKRYAKIVRLWTCANCLPNF